MGFAETKERLLADLDKAVNATEAEYKRRQGIMAKWRKGLVDATTGKQLADVVIDALKDTAVERITAGVETMLDARARAEERNAAEARDGEDQSEEGKEATL